MKPFVALIVAAGAGSRAGSGPPKQYRLLDGVPVLRRTVDTFFSVPGLAGLKIVIDPVHEKLYREAVTGLDLPEPVAGGASRRQSVRNGILSFTGLADDMPILIHDAARPFVTADIIAACVEKLKTAQAVTVAVPVDDTLRRVENDCFGEAVSRKNLWSVQTPQGFHYGTIRHAHENLSGDYTDDSQMVSAMNVPVEIVPGSRDNIKLTREDDFKKMTTITRTGLGYDVHAFGEDAAFLRIGGVDIPHTKKLLGHSDADVVLHAITDAIYGTVSSGDIGSHFPPSDEKFKNGDSAFFLTEAVAELKAAGGSLVHIDTVIVCEDPKIGPYRDAIRARVAGICALAVSSVSIKATTSEGLGFTGRREGIAAQALVTVQIKA